MRNTDIFEDSPPSRPFPAIDSPVKPNVTPDFRPSRCISPLRLAQAVSPQNDCSTMFNKKLSSPQRTIISFLSNQNKGFEEISRGSKDKAKEIFQGLGYTANFFEKVCRGIPSSSSSPSDSQTQNLNLMMP